LLNLRRYECRFWANPIAVIVANKAIAPWMREKVANGVFQAMEFLSLAFYLVGLLFA